MANDIARWFGIFAEGESLRQVSNTTRVNRVSNVLGTIKGLGCSIDKPLNGEGKGWIIKVDGSSDLDDPSGGDFETVDRKFALGSGDVSGTGSQKLYNKTTTVMDSNALEVFWDVVAGDTVTKARARFHIPASDTGTVYEVLCRDTAGNIFWANTTDTCST